MDAVDVDSVDVIPDGHVDDSCESVDMYGPPPCTQDSDCDSYGAGYYCDKTNTVNDSCGTPMSYPLCKKVE